MKIERETAFAEFEVALRTAPSLVGGRAYSGLDCEQILGVVFRYYAADGALEPLDLRKYERAKARLAREREAEKPIFEVVPNTSRAEVAAERALNEREEREERASRPFEPIDYTRGRAA